MTLFRRLKVDSSLSIPLSTQLSQQITWLIATEAIKPGDILPPVRKMAEQLGVNLHTVRAAYQHLEADRLVKTHHGKGTVVQPYDITKSLGSRSRIPSFSIGVFIPNYSAFHTELLKGLQQENTSDVIDPLLIICNTDDYSGNIIRLLNRLIVKGVDGLIISLIDGPGVESIKSRLNLTDIGKPIVFVNDPERTSPGVVINQEEAGFQATNHLIQHGHQHIGFIAPSLEQANVHFLREGYQLAHRFAGISIREELTSFGADISLEGGKESAVSLLQLPHPPSAIFAASESLAMGVMQAVNENSLNIPNDIAIISYGRTKAADYVEPPLTSIALPAYEMGVKAKTMLQKLIHDEQIDPSLVKLEPDLIIRSSCGCV